MIVEPVQGRAPGPRPAGRLSRDAPPALRRGRLPLSAALDGSLIQATPPLTITAAELDEALERLG